MRSVSNVNRKWQFCAAVFLLTTVFLLLPAFGHFWPRLLWLAAIAPFPWGLGHFMTLLKLAPGLDPQTLLHQEPGALELERVLHRSQIIASVRASLFPRLGCWLDFLERALSPPGNLPFSASSGPGAYAALLRQSHF